MKPSKELLEAVIGEGAGVDGNIQLTNNTLHYSMVTHMSQISIYEFMHMCKEWAYETQVGTNGKWLNAKKDPTWQHDQFCCYLNGYQHKYMRGDTEVEAIIKSCEWILQKKVQDDK